MEVLGLKDNNLCISHIFSSLLVVDRVADDYYRKLDIVISGDMDIVLKQSSLGPIHSEPDLKQLKIEEQPEEVEEEVVVHPVEVCVHEEDEDSGRKLSEKSSSSSGKVGIFYYWLTFHYCTYSVPLMKAFCWQHSNRFHVTTFLSINLVSSYAMLQPQSLN